MRRCYTTVFFLMALTVAVTFRAPGWFNFNAPHYKDSFTGWRGGIKIVSFVIVFFGWLYKTKNEMSEFVGAGLKYFQKTGAAFLENFLSFFFCLSMPFVFLSEIAGNSTVAAFFLSLAVLFAWSYALSLLLGFELTGPFVIMIWKMITTDVARFLSIYMILLGGYGVAFYALQEPPKWGQDELKGLFHDRIYTLFMSLLGGTDFVAFNEGIQHGYAPLASFLLLTNVIVVNILLLNLLIAMMGDTFGDVKENSTEEWHLAYAQIIQSIESELPEHFWTDKNPDGSYRQFDPYWTIVGDTRYLQVQEVQESWYSTEKVEPQEDWMKKFDVDDDGVISFVELAEGLAKMRNEAKDMDLVPDVVPQALGPQKVLPGRLDPKITKVS